MKSFTIKGFVCVLLLIGIGTSAYGGNTTSAFKLLEQAFKAMGELEPFREGVLHDYARGMSAIKHNPSPSVQFVEPAEGGTFRGYLAVYIENWVVDPSKAVNAGTQFANGHRERNTGHTHVWIIDTATGNVAGFTGAPGLLLNEQSGYHESAIFSLPPGTYKAYVQLQNHDHTPAIPATAPSFPGIDTVTFTVPVP